MNQIPSFPGSGSIRFTVALPSVARNGSLHARSDAGRRKCVVIPAAGDGKLTVGGVIVHVALPGMTLAPSVFMWSHILAFGKISRAQSSAQGLDRC